MEGPDRLYNIVRARVTKQRENIIQAIKDGVPAAEVKDDLARIATRREELQRPHEAIGMDAKSFSSIRLLRDKQTPPSLICIELMCKLMGKRQDVTRGSPNAH